MAGHDESGGELVEADKFENVQSLSMECHPLKPCRNILGKLPRMGPEGKEVRVPYRGSLGKTVQSILGGVRSACSYVGARRIKDLPKVYYVHKSHTNNQRSLPKNSMLKSNCLGKIWLKNIDSVIIINGVMIGIARVFLYILEAFS